jgi:hypothetical protein
MMSALPRRRSGQTDKILSPHLPYYTVEPEGGYVVAFVNDHVGVLSNEVLRVVFSVQVGSWKCLHDLSGPFCHHAATAVS